MRLKARRKLMRNVSVLIEGESGTGIDNILNTLNQQSEMELGLQPDVWTLSVNARVGTS